MLSVQAQQLSYRFADGTSLFHELSFSFDVTRSGLVGDNGVGKSILAALLAEQRQPSSGTLTVPASVTLVSQEQTFRHTTTVAEVLGVQDVLEARQQIAAGSCDARWFECIGEQWTLPEQRLAALQAMGLHLSLQTRWQQLSGGERQRILLWQALTQVAPVAPQLLILDEPSNHLDQEGRAWLLRQMRGYAGALLVISHDRQLLRQMEQIVELSALGVRCYGGNYDSYQTQKARETEAVARQLKTVQRQQKQAQLQAQKRLEQAQQRAAQGNKSRQRKSQSKVLLDAQKERATAQAGKRTIVDQQQSQRLAEQAQHLRAQQHLLRPQRLDFAPSKRHSKAVIVCREMVLPYGTSQTLSLCLHGNEKLHIQGANGSGKSSFLKILAGQLSPAAGTVALNAETFYLDQHFSLLDPSKTALQQLHQACSGFTAQELRTLLAGIGLRGEEAHRSIAQLSGGERMKLALLLISRQSSQPVLLLDEPDNHLDLASKILFAQTLAHYQGPVLLVSHDESFVCDAKIAQRLRLDGARAGAIESVVAEVAEGDNQ
ncbi:ABC transporter ATP-binding protein [Pseudidiomarina sediminum]|uniref:ABC transporter ATP-binding protein n=1 Tax=Pseudidiomarina sediminum TaxID=431675 RepID=A0A432Z3S5_9GAMM|nr:ATP-binding cassette domain-containing protein [Pseudidiomarina sediminum]RUO72537.1 ABC transporter ATP-binding protein [Pseudidiomarina sediminum]